jgi:hypothetical protein
MIVEEKNSAFKTLMYRATQLCSGTIVIGTGILALLSIASPVIPLPPELISIAAGIGSSAIASILQDISKGRNISDNELITQLTTAVEELKNVISPEEFFNTYNLLHMEIQKNHEKLQEISLQMHNEHNIVLEISHIEHQEILLKVTEIQEILSNQVPQKSQKTRLIDDQLILSINEDQKSIKDIRRVRYLDSLDSARCSLEFIDEKSEKINELYVKAQFLLSIIYGDEIVVTENQFFDSRNFLESFSELNTATRKKNGINELPIEVAIRKNHSDLFLVVAEKFFNKKFFLSSWPNFQKNDFARDEFVKFLVTRKRPNKDNFAFFEPLIDKLWDALEFFSNGHCIVADEISDKFREMVERIISLNDSDIDNLLIKYIESWNVINAAKEIREVLLQLYSDLGDQISQRSQIKIKLDQYGCEKDLLDGVYELVNSIYNHTLGVGANAGIIQNSLFNSNNNRYIKAGFSLANYLLDTNLYTKNPMKFDIFSVDYVNEWEFIEDPNRKNDYILFLNTVKKNLPWLKLLEMQELEKWQLNIMKFQASLSSLQSVVKKLEYELPSDNRKNLEKEREQLRRKLINQWKTHIKYVNKITSNIFWNLTPDSIILSHPDFSDFQLQIKYSFLNIKLDKRHDNIYDNWTKTSFYKGKFDEKD